MYDTTFSPRYRVWQETEWLPSDRAHAGYLLAEGIASAPASLVMPLQKLGAALRRTRGQLRHACADCLARAATEAARLIGTRAVCRAPFCSRTPDGSCPCCQGAFCRGCLTGGGYAVDEVACDHGSWPVIYSQASGRPSRADAAYSTAERYPPGGLCVPCGCERAHALKAAAAQAFEQDYAARLAPVPAPGAGATVHAVPAPFRLTSGGRLRETRQSREVARDYAAQIARRAAQAVADAPCRRGRAAAPAGDYPPHTGYVVIGTPR
jgi:hypothetical protein